MAGFNFKRQNELIEASLIFSMLNLADFKKDLGVDFSREEMEKARFFFANRRPPKNKGKNNFKKKRPIKDNRGYKNKGV